MAAPSPRATSARATARSTTTSCCGRSEDGFVGVNTTYRLAPQSPWPAAAEDLGAVVQWVADNIAARGGEPTRIYLMGHSAGAVHVASYVAHPEFQKVKGGGLAGAILVSGIYDLTEGAPGDPEKAYFGSDPSVYAERSSIRGLQATKIPLMIAGAGQAALHGSGLVLVVFSLA